MRLYIYMEEREWRGENRRRGSLRRKNSRRGVRVARMAQTRGSRTRGERGRGLWVLRRVNTRKHRRGHGLRVASIQ